MARRWKAINPIRDEAKAIAILDAALNEREQAKAEGRKWNGNHEHGWSIRLRNRLMSEAGYDYNEAHAASYQTAASDDT